MTRRSILFFLPALLLGFGGLWTGCSKKMDCKATCEKMKKCSGEIATAMAKKMGMPEAQAKEMAKEAAKKFEDVDGCVKECKKDKKKDSEKTKKMKACLAKSSCKAAAECFVNVMMEKGK